MNQNQVDRKARKLANDLLGDIEYGDSRDNPKWRAEVIAPAGRLIASLIREFIVPQKKQKSGGII